MIQLELPEHTDNSEIANYVKAGNEAVMRADFGLAERQFRLAEEAGPLAVPHFNLGIVRYQLGHTDEGLRLMDEGMALAETSTCAPTTLERMRTLRSVMHGRDLDDSPVGHSPENTRPN